MTFTHDRANWSDSLTNASGEKDGQESNRDYPRPCHAATRPWSPVSRERPKAEIRVGSFIATTCAVGFATGFSAVQMIGRREASRNGVEILILFIGLAFDFLCLVFDKRRFILRSDVSISHVKGDLHWWSGDCDCGLQRRVGSVASVDH